MLAQSQTADHQRLQRSTRKAVWAMVAQLLVPAAPRRSVANNTVGDA